LTSGRSFEIPPEPHRQSAAVTFELPSLTESSAVCRYQHTGILTLGAQQFGHRAHGNQTRTEKVISKTQFRVIFVSTYSLANCRPNPFGLSLGSKGAVGIQHVHDADSWCPFSGVLIAQRCYDEYPVLISCSGHDGISFSASLKYNLTTKVVETKVVPQDGCTAGIENHSSYERVAILVAGKGDSRLYVFAFVKVLCDRAAPIR
jgi:hypothetical protein